CHIDANPDNFLIFEKNNQTEVRLIDWEYAGMQDPDLDIAMFAIYSQYNREQIDFLIGAYFEEGCEERIRMKIYAYVATAGLLWSNWCEYKQQLGVEFGDYAQSQYDYAKEYSFIVSEYLSTFEDKDN
ncbi:TPA: phosphotransferase family protein, partial [Streptococcus suis]